jgi:3-deoxy-7-phosphoheptulonate synthase
MSAPGSWSPRSWRARTARHQPPWPDPEHLERVVDRIRTLPPLVSIGEIENLKSQLSAAAEGRVFILQGGDCAERFADCNPQSIVRKLKIILQMSLVLTYGARRPVVRIGRIAGQYGKPRSSEVETVGDRDMCTFRGDNVNDFAPDPSGRVPDPERLERGHLLSATTLNFVRALVEGGFASLRAPEHWELDFLPKGGGHEGYRDIAERIRDAIDYLESLGSSSKSMREVDFFTSHEALLLPYEEAVTRRRRDGEHYFNVGAHLLWIGHRTRRIDEAHVEYCRGIRNPLGIKVGPGAVADELLELLDALDPDQEPGRIVLISRFGRSAVSELLPPLVRAVKASGREALWSCDPMHGNTVTAEGGYKTRSFDDIAEELSLTFGIHAAEGSHLGGVHFELTGDDVTECTGGAEGLRSSDLHRSYETGCDPRLNYAQSMEMAFLISRMLEKTRRPMTAARVPW